MDEVMTIQGAYVALLFSVLLLLATLRMACTIGTSPSNPLLKVLTYWVWVTPLTLLAPILVGYFISGELSPWPPAAFATVDAYTHTPLALAVALSVAAIDIWLLWIPACLLLWTQPELQSKRLKIHGLYTFLGALLMVPWLG